jgi:putative phosphoesterase
MERSTSRRGVVRAAIARRTLAMHDGAIKLVVVADTHGRPHPDAATRIEAERPDAILHAGDIGDLGVLDGLARIAPVLAVRGNIDELAPGLPDALTIDVKDPKRSEGTGARGGGFGGSPPIEKDGAAVRLRILLFHIALLGTRLRADAARLARAEGANLVVCGHSHVPFLGRDRAAVVFNPGSIGPRRFQLPIVFGVLAIDEGGVSMHHVDCETGKLWLP